ncbi:MAG: hypothetical protein JWQ74_3161 [Marmoricola sp.]|nr:hypothetical protein [Marmoricola sp.]
MGVPASYPCRVHPSPEAVRRVRAWVRGALVLETGRPWTPEPASEDVADLLAAVQRHRVAELLGSQADGLALPAEIRGPIAEIRAVSRRALMVQVLEIGRLQDLFAEAGLACLAIKGPALAVQTTGDRAARGSGDVDLFVDPLRVEDAHRLLLAHGWSVRPGSEVDPGTWAWRHVLSNFNAFTYAGPGSTVDLHWRLDPTLDALPTFAVAWERRELVDLGGREVATLGPGELLPHASLHSAKDSWRWMRSLVDVHRLAADPRTWERSLETDPLRRLEISTLAVTRFVVGLPPTVPAAVLGQLDQVPASVLTRALVAQERPVRAPYPFPGLESMRLLRYMVAASPTARDVRHSAVSTVLPVKSVVGIEASSAWTGVPLTLWHRVRRLRRRSVAWARREPGAGVVDPLIRSGR